MYVPHLWLYFTPARRAHYFLVITQGQTLRLHGTAPAIGLRGWVWFVGCGELGIWSLLVFRCVAQSADLRKCYDVLKKIRTPGFAFVLLRREIACFSDS